MKEFYDFDTTPYEVSCQQIGPNYDPIKAKEEAKETIKLLCRKFGTPPFGSVLKVASNPHDFGDYLSIRYVFNNQDGEHLEYMASLDNNWPKDWDDVSVVEK
jgi:hypothetical protein